MDAAHADDFSEDDDLHDDHAEDSPEASTVAGGKGKGASKDGRKKEAAESRKAQNRVAQREFRLRKQQYIKELETRIEVLSASSDTRFDHLRDVVRALVDENRELRGMLSQMGSFFKTNLSHVLPTMGLTPELYDEIITKGNSQTALDAFIKSKERIQGFTGAVTPAIPSQTLSHSIFAGSGTGVAATSTPKTNSKRKRTSNVAGDKPDPSAPSKEASGSGATARRDDGQDDPSQRKATKLDGTVPLAPNPSPDIFESPESTSTPLSGAMGSHDIPPGGYSALPVDNDFSQIRRSSSDLRSAPSIVMNTVPSGSYSAMSNFSSGPLPSSFQSQAYSDLLGLGNSSTSQYNPSFSLDNNPPENLNQFTASNPSSTSFPDYQNLDQSLASQFDLGSFDFSFSPNVVGVTPAPQAAPSIPAPTLTTSGLAQPPFPRPLQPGESPESYFESPDIKAAMGQLDERKQQAMQLIGYHLSNFRANPSYHLPPSLVPTMLQRTVPHGRLIDGIPIPNLRDAMIIHRDRFNLGIALHQCIGEFRLHGTDVLATESWEIGQAWMRLYPFLIDQSIVDHANHWRLQRGDELVDVDEIRRLAAGSR